MSLNTPTDRAASNRVQQSRGPTAVDGSPLSRSAMVDTPGENSHEIAVVSFIAANLPNMDSENIEKDGVYQAIGANIMAEKGERGLTSQHFNAMQDKASTGKFAVLSKREYKPALKYVSHSDDDDEEEAVAKNEEAEQNVSNSEGEEDSAATAPTKKTPNAPKKTTSRRRANSDGERFDTAYVEAHPEENFTHKGKGRWRRGLPNPGDNIKSGVRGPDAAAWTKANTGRKV